MDGTKIRFFVYFISGRGPIGFSKWYDCDEKEAHFRFNQEIEEAFVKGYLSFEGENAEHVYINMAGVERIEV